MIAIDTITALPVDTTHGVICGRCTSALERKVRHESVAAVRECDRLSRIQDEISETAYATELADANRARFGSSARMIAYYRP
jgi:hypothetical protein